MRKNWTMRVGASLLALTLITSCFVGGTWAKYITSGEGNDSARVARFGITVDATSDAFSTEYRTNDGDNQSSVTVKASDDENVVAPGTGHQLAAVTIEPDETNKPEVAVAITYDAKFDIGEGWKAKGEGDTAESFYCPLLIVFGEGEKMEKISGLDYSSAEEFEQAVNDKIVNYKDTFYPDDWGTKPMNPPVISWEWPFEKSTGVKNTEAKQDDVKDTYLGDQAATGTAATVSIDLTATVTQID